MNTPQRGRIRGEPGGFFCSRPMWVFLSWSQSTSNLQFFAAVNLRIPFVYATTPGKGLNGSQRFESVPWLHHVGIQSHPKMNAVRSLTIQRRRGVFQKSGIVNRSFLLVLSLFTPFEVKYFRLATFKAKMLSSSYVCSLHKTDMHYFDVLLTVHLSIFILVINQLDAQNFVLQ